MIDIKTNPNAYVNIATGRSRLAKTWRNEAWTWRRLVGRCSEPLRTSETLAEWEEMDHDTRGRIKDVGGFVAATLDQGQRKNGKVLLRSMATLDVDYATPDTWERFTAAFGCAALCYSTHSHTPARPRLRLVIPFREELTPSAYEPVARLVAAKVGIDLFDDTTYQPARLFYWPSCPLDGEFAFHFQDGPFLDAKALLAGLPGWESPASWPRSSRETERLWRDMTGTVPETDATPHPARPEDPRTKPGVLGAFCRAYPIREAIREFLPDVYAPAPGGRWTYKGGSTSGGLAIYDNLWAYSNHDSDPVGGRLLNAFDLVRLHRYGQLDAKARPGTEATRLPSFEAMADLAMEKTTVMAELRDELARKAADDFGGIGIDTADVSAERRERAGERPEKGGKRTGNSEKQPGNDEKRPKNGEIAKAKAKEKDQKPDDDRQPSGAWTDKLDVDRKGRPRETVANIVTILENAPAFAGKLRHNDFTHLDEAGGLPWRDSPGAWSDRDDANLREWLERKWGINSIRKTSDALVCVTTKRSYHPVRDYLDSLSWDGTERLDRLVIDYLGAEDTPLNRAMTRKHFAAAVARVMEPGRKYDHCLTLAGPEGTGKSTLFAVMGGEWFSDSVSAMDGKESMEALGNAWIIELAELTSLKRSETESVKAFLSKTSDKYRPAYGRHMAEFPRQCVFCGTTNEDVFLRGDTGNRRFWVIGVDPALRGRSDVRAAVSSDRDQLWAEAVVRWREGEALYLDGDLEAEARAVQRERNSDDADALAEEVRRFLETPLPRGWDGMSTRERHRWYDDDSGLRAKPERNRDMACVQEFTREWLGKGVTDRDARSIAIRVAKIIDATPGWERVNLSRHAERLYGLQRSWRRVYAHDATLGDFEVGDENL